mmetsp:Transcript_32746/g.75351  ORF Transcript_32746/g.75351 Transcript_32746/m.75351 type:complete len:264 (-) Transcript_32746:1736-2527(-)|eukprot:CAMPEP_0113302070 /NCGR_PEP_ID=MMETSP0010_2-20120614/3038_1 /TAXON_ID=216773 ORGANISM="Corethron hystrix, Strain 308" /NCGR_SAMPLE_ID=MMETSP0010_2 /ASSEMBLY_ACC=CAM_ASM_000155 /LENGTH=263 /DNA_ID=CAMNT_0000155803 /DNA_START=59 /DNA_END=850 /DNA_ORIENTATION=+ /assembly_acc=CAM_ASM_000155
MLFFFKTLIVLIGSFITNTQHQGKANAFLIFNKSNYVRFLARSALFVSNGDGAKDEVCAERRPFLLSFAAFTAAAYPGLFLSPSPATAAVTELRPYEDPKWNFRIDVPSAWSETTRELEGSGDRRTLVLFVDPADANTSLFIAYTPIRDDFTTLGSFGDVVSVGETTILPKGAIMGVTDTAGKMLSAVSKKNAYFYDYVVNIASQPERHLRTIFTLQTASDADKIPQAGSMLVTITAQTTQDRYESNRELFEMMVDSYSKVGK